MSTKDTNEFMGSLPQGPLVQHLGKAHAIARLLPEFGRVGYDTKNLLEALDHSLREIARYTAEPYTNRPPIGSYNLGGRETLSEVYWNEIHDYPPPLPVPRGGIQMSTGTHAPKLPNPILSQETVDRIAAAGRVMQESFREGFARVARRAEERRRMPLEDLNEAVQQRAYQAKIENERAIGRAFVTNYAYKTRREIRARGLHMPHTIAATEGH